MYRAELNAKRWVSRWKKIEARKKIMGWPPQPGCMWVALETTSESDQAHTPVDLNQRYSRELNDPNAS